MDYNYRNVNYELISIFLLIGILPICITHIYSIIGLIFFNATFNYSTKLLFIEVCILLICVFVTLLIILFSNKMTIKADDKYLLIDNIVIKKENIKSLNYESLSIWLLPLLYFVKKGNGLILEIYYISDDGFNKKFITRIRKKIYDKIIEFIR